MGKDISRTAMNILRARYLKKDNEGNVIETPDEMFQRVAKHIASAETTFDSKANIKKITDHFYQIMTSLEFLPNSPTLMNAGKEIGQLASCFVLPVDDSLESIFDAVKNTALIHQSGGGTGFSFSHLRPSNDIVSSTSGVASGPVSFMKVFNQATDVIKQGGTRRGANMGVLRVDHPDIIDFITIKRDPHELTNFNLSVGITREFMIALEENKDYALINPRTHHHTKTINAQEVFDLIAECAWETGEPGILFLDCINEANPTPQLGKIECTNPCGEQPLFPYEACNLGSINLTKMIKKGPQGYEVDWDKFERTVINAVRFLDNVIEINRYPLPQIKNVTRGNRKIGLGVMGFAQFLILLGIPYNSEEGISSGERIMRFIHETGHKASQELARTRGAFPNFSGSQYDQKGLLPMRNATVTTIAPTGTVSLIAGCSPGIEPLYAICYTRKILEEFEFTEIDPIFIKIAKEMGFWRAELVIPLRRTGLLKDIDEIPHSVLRLFKTAFDISPFYHVRMQSAFQHYTDNAVSKTINFSPKATICDVKETLITAYQSGCKGITIYRSGTRKGQVLTCGSKEVC